MGKKIVPEDIKKRFGKLLEMLDSKERHMFHIRRHWDSYLSFTLREFDFDDSELNNLLTDLNKKIAHPDTTKDELIVFVTTDLKTLVDAMLPETKKRSYDEIDDNNNEKGSKEPARKKTSTEEATTVPGQADAQENRISDLERSVSDLLADKQQSERKMAALNARVQQLEEKPDLVAQLADARRRLVILESKNAKMHASAVILDQNTHLLHYMSHAGPAEQAVVYWNDHKDLREFHYGEKEIYYNVTQSYRAIPKSTSIRFIEKLLQNFDFLSKIFFDLIEHNKTAADYLFGSLEIMGIDSDNKEVINRLENMPRIVISLINALREPRSADAQKLYVMVLNSKSLGKLIKTMQEDSKFPQASASVVREVLAFQESTATAKLEAPLWLKAFGDAASIELDLRYTDDHLLDPGTFSVSNSNQ